MRYIRVAVGAVLVATTLAVAAPAQAPSRTEPSTADQVKHWTQRQWSAAKTEWQKDKAKWDMCNQRATQQHLSGRKSWSYIYDCMKR
jgi:hypothetical protein